MSATLERVEREALALMPDERARLVDRLLCSLDGNLVADIEAAWLAEVERRYAEHQQGRRQGIPAAEVLAEADRLLG